MDVILGVSAAAGIGIGTAYVLPEEQERKIPKYRIDQQKLVSEWERLKGACDKVTEELKAHLEEQGSTKEQKDVLESYLLMLSAILSPHIFLKAAPI